MLNRWKWWGPFVIGLVAIVIASLSIREDGNAFQSVFVGAAVFGALFSVCTYVVRALEQGEPTHPRLTVIVTAEKTPDRGLQLSIEIVNHRPFAETVYRPGFKHPTQVPDDERASRAQMSPEPALPDFDWCPTTSLMYNDRERGPKAQIQPRDSRHYHSWDFNPGTNAIMSVVPPDTLEIVVKPVAGTKPIIVTGQMIKTAILRAFEKAQ